MESKLHHFNAPMRARQMVRQRGKKNVFGYVAKISTKTIRVKELRLARGEATKRECSFSYSLRLLHRQDQPAAFMERQVGTLWVHLHVFRKARTSQPKFNRCSFYQKNSQPLRLSGEVHVQTRIPCKVLHSSATIHEAREKRQTIQR